MPIKVVVYRREDDPICLRASIGGDEETGYYCTFRGSRREVSRMLEVVSEVMKHVPDDLEIDVEIPFGKAGDN